jgi:hypothetical protein
VLPWVDGLEVINGTPSQNRTAMCLAVATGNTRWRRRFAYGRASVHLTEVPGAITRRVHGVCAPAGHRRRRARRHPHDDIGLWRFAGNFGEALTTTATKLSDWQWYAHVGGVFACRCFPSPSRRYSISHEQLQSRLTL